MLSDEAAASILYAVATGMVDRALDIVNASGDLDESSQGIVEEIRGSTSWRVTAPLRSMVTRFRR